MQAWFARQVPAHPETRLRLVCEAEGGKGRTRLAAFDGDRLVYSASYDYWTWSGHACGQLLMPAFVEAAEATARDCA